MIAEIIVYLILLMIIVAFYIGLSYITFTALDAWLEWPPTYKGRVCLIGAALWPLVWALGFIPVCLFYTTRDIIKECIIPGVKQIIKIWNTK